MNRRARAELIVDRTLAILDSLPVRLVSLVILVAFWYSLSLRPWHNDAWHMLDAWRNGPLYPVAWLQPASAYGYSPIFPQLLFPLTHVGWPHLSELWDAVQIVALVWMLGPALAVVALYFPWPALPGFGTAVQATINNGNPQLVFAAFIVIALTRFPVAWTFVLLTKSSSGIGILYYAFMRQWRTLATVVGVTIAISAFSFVLNPAWTFEWIRVWLDAATRTGSGPAVSREIFVAVPMPVRSIIGVGVVALAARTNKLWLVPLGCFLALPDIHLGGFAVLTAVPAVWLRTRHRGGETAATPSEPSPATRLAPAAA